MPWQLCSASVKPAGTIQVFLENSKTTPENSIKFKTEVFFIKICCKAYIRLTFSVAIVLGHWEGFG